VIADSIPGGRRGPVFGAAAADAPARAAGVAGLSTLEQALGCLLREPSLWLALNDAERELLDPAHLSEGLYRTVAEAMFDLAAGGRAPTLQEVSSHLDGDASGAATDLYQRIDYTTGDDAERTKAYFRDCVRLLLDQDERPRVLELARERAAAQGVNRRVLPRPRSG
jgi:hypothetical protein